MRKSKNLPFWHDKSFPDIYIPLRKKNNAKSFLTLDAHLSTNISFVFIRKFFNGPLKNDRKTKQFEKLFIICLHSNYTTFFCNFFKKSIGIILTPFWNTRLFHSQSKWWQKQWGNKVGRYTIVCGIFCHCTKIKMKKIETNLNTVS